MRTAFKEWAVICRALARGQQTVILRKGGIVEEGGQFRPDHPEFLLFPTYLHQSPESVTPVARPWLMELEQEQRAAETVTITHWCHVDRAICVRSLDAVMLLKGEHVWSDEIVLERFHRWGDAIYALVVRVHALAAPVTLDLRAEYTGCKSWVEFVEDVATDGSTSVLSDADFAQRAAWVNAQLQMS
jgi:hypothetical protein